MKRGALAVLAFIAATGWINPAQALCVLCSCSAATTGLAFGPYDPTSTSPREAIATISISCSGVVALVGTIDVALSPGGAAGISARRMAQGANTLSYNIYSDANHTILWGDGSGGSSTVTLPFNGLLTYAASVKAYGRIPAHQYVRAGAYTDTVTVTVTY